MKFILSFITIIFSTMFAFSQETKDTDEMSFEYLVKENALYKSEISRLNDIITEKEQIIGKNTIDTHLLKSTIEYQDKIFVGSGHWIDLMAIFLTILSIGLPLLTYLFGIKPSQEQLKKNKEFVKKFLQQKEKDEINYFLNALSSKNVAEKNRAGIVLSVYVYYDFSSKQIDKLIKVAEQERDNENLKQTINNILSIHYSKATERYFIKLLKKSEIIDFYYIDRFFLLSGIEKYFMNIANICKKDAKMLYNVLVYLKSLSHTAVIKILDNKTIINSCGEALIEIKPLINSLISADIDIQEIFFYKTIENIENERKKQQEQEEKEKQKLLQAEYEHRLSKDDIAKRSGYRWNGTNVINSKGEIVEQISFVYSMFTGGLNKVQKGVEFNGEIIPLDTIKKTKISS